MIRKPIAAGRFYAGEEEELREQIRQSFLHERGPGREPSGQRQGWIKGVIVPHAGYPFSGPCAAHSFKALAESEFADLYLILGPSHIGFHKSCFSEDDWETPLGVAVTDSDFGRILEENSIDLVPFPHKEEHSIEVQIPFLQHASSGMEDKLRLIPVMVAETEYKSAAENLIKAVKKYASQGKNIVIIASSDFTHLGASFGFTPFRDSIKENMHKLDRGAIGHILKLDSEGFMDYCSRTGATICGKHAIYAMIELMRDAGAKAELLKYYTSADIVGDYSHAVGYASILFR